jgi:hypothetical protein
MTLNVENKEKEQKNNVVFFIDQQQFKSEQTELTVRTLLVEFAHEDPAQTTLVLRQGNELKKFDNLDELVRLKNGMKFVVYHNTPTSVS